MQNLIYVTLCQPGNGTMANFQYKLTAALTILESAADGLLVAVRAYLAAPLDDLTKPDWAGKQLTQELDKLRAKIDDYENKLGLGVAADILDEHGLLDDMYAKGKAHYKSQEARHDLIRRIEQDRELAAAERVKTGAAASDLTQPENYQRVATVARSIRTRLLTDYKKQRSWDQADDSSIVKDSCHYAAVILRAALEEAGVTARGRHGYVRDGHNLFDHFWVQVGDWYVDVTLDQFNSAGRQWPPILIKPIADCSFYQPIN